MSQIVVDAYTIDVNTLGSTTIRASVSDDYGNLAESNIGGGKRFNLPTISFTGDDAIKVLIGGAFVLPSDWPYFLIIMKLQTPLLRI